MQREERLKRLAAEIDQLAEKDRKAIAQAELIAGLRRRAAMELYSVCRGFVDRLNALLRGEPLKLDPPEYSEQNFNDTGMNLFQINVRGRIVQVEFEATDELLSTEDLRVPYTLHGAVRCFNQELLDKDLVEEQLLFYTVENQSNAAVKTMWRFFDARTYKAGPFDEDYLLGLMEQIAR